MSLKKGLTAMIVAAIAETLLFAAPQAPPKRPNILVIFGDDIGM